MLLCVLWLQSEIFIFGLVFKSILPPILSHSIYWPHSKWNQPSQRSWFYCCECWDIEDWDCTVSWVWWINHYCVFFLFAHGAAIPARVPWCFPGRVCGPIWAPQHVCRHDSLHIQTGRSYKYTLPVFLIFTFFQTSLIFLLICLQLQHEASVSMQFWDNPTVDGFHSLLMTPKPMIRTSDHVFQYDTIKRL